MSSTTVISAILWMASFVFIIYSLLYGDDQTVYEFQSRGRRGGFIVPEKDVYDSYDSFVSEEEAFLAESNWPITGLALQQREEAVRSLHDDDYYWSTGLGRRGGFLQKSRRSDPDIDEYGKKIHEVDVDSYF